MKNLKKIASKDAVVTQIQNNTETAINQIITKQIVDGVLLTDISLTTGTDNIIDHKLGRRLLGYLITKKNTNGTVWNTTITDKKLTLNCSANMTVDVWVF